ncbi:MAG: hypothetical protein ACE5K9_08095 [Candidatus Methylomirabilales bacterium]
MSVSSSRQSVRWPMVLGLLLGLLPHQAQAVSLSLSTTQIDEALRYGQKSRAIPFALFAQEWRAEGVQGPNQRLGGTAWLQSPFARVAHASWAAAHRGFPVNVTDLDRQLKQVGSRLAFAVTLMSPQQHAETYQVSLHQAGKIVYPSHVERGQDDSDREMAWVYLYCLFPAEEVDLQETVILVVTDKHGDLLPFIFDLSQMR